MGLPHTYAGKVIMVLTTNIILKWNRSESGAHRLDENLSEISLITKDAFEPSLPLSVVVHGEEERQELGRSALYLPCRAM